MLTADEISVICEGNTTSIQKTVREVNPKVFPNPSKGDLTIHLGRLSRNVSIQIFNSVGKNIFSKQIPHVSSETINI